MSEKSLKGTRVLIMEDEYLIAMDVEQLCRDHGAEDVIILRTLDELGADPFARHTFNAVIMDVCLGGETTFDFARQLAERGIPFIFATAYSGTETLFNAFPEVPVVGKPYTGTALIDAMGSTIRGLRASGGA